MVQYSRSIWRCFHTMELLKREERPLSASEIAKELDAPLSSTVELLKGMSDVGYLTYDAIKRTYFPSLKFGELGAWVLRSRVGESVVEEAVKRVFEKTGETVCVSCVNDLEMELVKIVQGRHSLTLSLEPGTRLSAFDTAVGRAMLSTLDDTVLTSFYSRSHRRLGAPEMALDEVKEQARKDASLGYVEAYNSMLDGVGAIAVPFFTNLDFNLVLSVGGPVDRVRENRKKLIDSICEEARLARAGALG